MASAGFLVLSCVAGFLIGGIPFGYLVGHFVLKDDIRKHGSGNIGASNVGRILGWNWGGLVLFLDALKGLIPTLTVGYLATTVMSSEWLGHVKVATGMSAILGHMYPISLRLRGGKGVATALGVVIVLAPESLAIALAVFVATLVCARRIALASMLAAVSFGVACLTLAGEQAWTAPEASRTAFAICVPLLIVWRHRGNIGRLLAGTEPTVRRQQQAAGHTVPSTSNRSVGDDNA